MFMPIEQSDSDFEVERKKLAELRRRLKPHGLDVRGTTPAWPGKTEWFVVNPKTGAHVAGTVRPTGQVVTVNHDPWYTLDRVEAWMVENGY